MSEISVVDNKAAAPAAKKGLFSRAIAAMNNKTAKTLFKCVGMPLALWLAARGVANAEDLAAAGKEDAGDTFGENSTMMYYFMLAEVILVFLAYFKTHNPATFLLIPVFIVITGIVFTIIASRSGG